MRARNDKDRGAAKANRSIIADARVSIAEREIAQRAQRRADFDKGEYGSLTDLLAAASKV